MVAHTGHPSDRQTIQPPAERREREMGRAHERNFFSETVERIARAIASRFPPN